MKNKWNAWSVKNTDQALLLRSYGLSLKKIAKQMGLTRNAVLSRLHRLDLKNGRVPNLVPKKYARKNVTTGYRSSYFKKIGRNYNCNVCSRKFEMRSKFDRFCPNCIRNIGENYYY